MEYKQIARADRDDLYTRMAHGEVFLWNAYEQMVFRFTPSGAVFAKARGMAEFRTQEGSTVVADALLEGKEISAEAYSGYV